MKLLVQIIILIFFLSFIKCVNKDKGLDVNTSHLDYLYEEFEVNESKMAFIHIYSNYPNYAYISDDDEGMACVDDAARAAIFYLNHFEYLNDQKSISKNKRLLKFLLYMQSEGGYYYNFIWDDYTINKDFKTSVAEPNWWSWRALWALTESYPYYRDNDSSFGVEISNSIDKIISAIKIDLPQKKENEIIEGIALPTWLPNKYAADQTSILIIGLINYYKIKNDQEIRDIIVLLNQGIIQMQIKDESNPYYGAFLSWQTYWHAWGNSQSYALLKSYDITGDENLLEGALKELDNFYNIFVENKILSSFQISNENEKIIIKKQNEFPQIAYNFRPLIFASMEAYNVTNEIKYLQLAGNIGKWFNGNNPAGVKIYNSNSGIVFDGIEGLDKINMNSGAESTIEALLSILAINQNNIAVETFISK